MGGWLDQLDIMLPQPNLSWDWAELGKKDKIRRKGIIRQARKGDKNENELATTEPVQRDYGARTN